jgi:hypothetical protein
MDVAKHGRMLWAVLEDILEGIIQPDIETGSSSNHIETLQKLYGPKLYKCRFPSCEASSEAGFETSAQRQLHEHKHARPYKCLSEDCTFKEVGFATTAALQHHQNEHHNDALAQRKRKARNIKA